MTDKELLEAAARAAGIDLANRYRWNPMIETYEGWCPLTDDGDALRLAVKLELTISPDKKDIEVIAWEHPTKDDCHPFGIETKERGADPYVATRRAIVRTAAEIGLQLNAAEKGNNK